MTPAEFRRTREVELDLTMGELARTLELGKNTITAIETGEGEVKACYALAIEALVMRRDLEDLRAILGRLAIDRP